MSVDLLISSINPLENRYLSDYRIDKDDYANNLILKFPYAKIFNNLRVTDYFLLKWVLDDINRNGAEGGLQIDKITVSFSRRYWNTKDYILWHRSYIPEYVPLYLFDSLLENIYPLTLETTKSDLINLLGRFDGE